MREHASERERLYIEADYYGMVTGEREKLLKAAEEERAAYPRYAAGYVDTGNAYLTLGQYQPALDAFRQASALDPSNGSLSGSIINPLMALRRFDEVRQLQQQVMNKKIG